MESSNCLSRIVAHITVPVSTIEHASHVITGDWCPVRPAVAFQIRASKVDISFIILKYDLNFLPCNTVVKRSYGSGSRISRPKDVPRGHTGTRVTA